MHISKNARAVLERRYLTRDEQGRLLEDVEGMFQRVAQAVASAEERYGGESAVQNAAEIFYARMTNLEFLPNSPTLMNAGRPLGQLSACFVLPVPDSMEGIFDAVRAAALIHKSGGGTGFSFSRLRPGGASVRSTGGVASGPISFMKVFNTATEAVKQGGTRRGANMGILRVDHPDIEQFIQCKADSSEITNFNISIGLTEAFMQAVQAGGQYNIIDPRDSSVIGQKSAKVIFDLIVDMAWRNGEPGIVFLDRMNRDNVTPALGQIESTNPCGEQPLLPYESCNLGSINLGLMHRGGAVDYDRLGAVVDDAVRFLDNVIDINQYPLEQIADMSLKTRKIGLGVMGFADLLFRLGIPYASEQGINTAEKIMGFIQKRSKKASIALAEERGPFPAFAESTLADGPPIRNATTTTIAPTGTISIIAGASSGVEPLFALAFVRNVMDNDSLPEADPYFLSVAKEKGFASDSLLRRIAAEGSVAHINEVPADVRDIFQTAHDISPEYHVRMQAAFQKHIDNAVSKTVNFPNSATKNDVRRVFTLAYEMGCKGVTIYRDGSRAEQVLSVGKKQNAEPEPAPSHSKRLTPRPRPAVTQGLTEKVEIGCGNLYITVNYDEQGICEVFTMLGRAGGCPSQSEASARLASIALRAGVDVGSVIEQLRGIRCHSTLRKGGLSVLSCPDAIGRTLEKVQRMLEQGTQTTLLDVEEVTPTIAPMQIPLADDPCPDCASPLEHEGGCVICRNCGYSKCN